MQLISYGELQAHNSPGDCWLAIDGKVYDITKFLSEHPGGEDVVLEAAGTDASDAFEDIGHSQSARDMLPKYLVGELDGPVPEKDGRNSKAPKKDGADNPGFLKLVVAPILIMSTVGFLIKKLM